MKKLIIFIVSLLTFHFSLFAQREDTTLYLKYSGYGPQYRDIWATRTLRLPDTVHSFPQIGIPGALATNTAGTTLFTWNGSAWVAISGGGTPAGSVTGNGLYPRIAFWMNATSLSSGANINIDSSNTRMGFNTTAPTHTITLDSTAARATTAGNTSAGGGGISFYYTTNQTSNYQRAHIYASGNGLAIMANQTNGAATFYPLTLNHPNTYVNSAGQLNSVGVNSTSIIQGNNDFQTTSAAAFFRSNNYSAIANNSQMRLQIVSQNQAAGDFNGIYIDGTSGQTQTGTTAFSIFKIGYNPTTTGSGKYSYINLGSVTGSNFVSKWRVFTNAHTVINDSTDNGYMLDVVGGTTRLAAGTASYAPLNITPGVYRSVPANGDIEFNGSDLRYTAGGVSYTVATRTKRVTTVTSASIIAPDINSYDAVKITALAVPASINAPIGTPSSMQELIIRITDNGTSQNLSWNAIYRASADLPLPGLTTAGKTMYMKFYYNPDSNTYDFVSFLNGF